MSFQYGTSVSFQPLHFNPHANQQPQQMSINFKGHRKSNSRHLFNYQPHTIQNNLQTSSTLNNFPAFNISRNNLQDHRADRVSSNNLAMSSQNFKPVDPEKQQFINSSFISQNNKQSIGSNFELNFTHSPQKNRAKEYSSRPINFNPDKNFNSQSPVKNYSIQNSVKDYSIQNSVKDYSVKDYSVKDYSIQNSVKDYSMKNSVKDFSNNQNSIQNSPEPKPQNIDNKKFNIETLTSKIKSNFTNTNSLENFSNQKVPKKDYINQKDSSISKAPKKDDEISYTKFLLMELKNEELNEIVTSLKSQISYLNEDISNIKQKHNKEVEVYKEKEKEKEQIFFQNLLRKQQEIDQLKKTSREQLNNVRLRASEDYNNLKKKSQEQYMTLKNKSSEEYLAMKTKLTQEYLTLKTKSTQEYQQLSQSSLKRYEEMRISKDNVITKLVDRLTIQKQQERQLIRKQHTHQLIDQLELVHREIIEKDKVIETLQRKFNAIQSDIEAYQQKQLKKQYHYRQLSSTLQQVINRVKQDNVSLQETLQLQLREAKILHQRIQILQDENNHLKDQSTQKCRQIQQLNNQFRVRELKLLSEKNRLITELNFNKTTYDNHRHTVEKKLGIIQGKYKLSLRDIQSKDEFILKTLIGKIPPKPTNPNYINVDLLEQQKQLKAYIEEILVQYRGLFETADKNEEVHNQNQKLKQRLQIYETMNFSSISEKSQ